MTLSPWTCKSALIAPLLGIHIVVALILSATFYKEIISIPSWICLMLCVSGVAGSAYFAGKDNDVDSLADFMLLLVPEHPGFTMRMVFIVFSVGVVVSLIVYTDFYTCGQLEDSATDGNLLGRVAFAVLSGIFGGFAELGAKLISALVLDIHQMGFIAAFSRLPTWGVVIFFPAAMSGGVLSLNAAIIRLPTSVVVPISNAFVLLTASLGSSVLLNETPSNVLMYALALGTVVVSTAGLFLLADTDQAAAVATSPPSNESSASSGDSPLHTFTRTPLPARSIVSASTPESLGRLSETGSSRTMAMYTRVPLACSILPGRWVSANKRMHSSSAVHSNHTSGPAFLI